MIAFAKLFVLRLSLFLYFYILLSAGVLALQFVPFAEIVSGMLDLTGVGALYGVVAFAQWAVADGMLANTLLFAFLAPIPLSLVFSLLFSGAFGSFSKGMELAAEFPAKEGTGLIGGYRQRFFHTAAFFYVTLALAFLLALVWAVATIPLAIVGELARSGLIQPALKYAAIAVTAAVVYFGLMFLRVYAASFVPSLYSGAGRPFGAALSFAGRNFFKITKYYLISDAVFAAALAVYFNMGDGTAALLTASLVSAFILFYQLFAIFSAFAADGYGYDELDARAAGAYGLGAHSAALGAGMRSALGAGTRGYNIHGAESGARGAGGNGSGGGADDGAPDGDIYEWDE